MTRFHYIVRGIHIADDKVLLAKEKNADNTFLPGGHIEFGEESKAALKREIAEEIGKDSVIGTFIGVIEHMWPDGKLDNHELNLVFAVKIKDISTEQAPISCEPHLEFLWATIQNIEEYNLLPPPLEKVIKLGIKRRVGYWASTLGQDA
jgi:8-oxo-dGTP pyrophosphatase MutT (NUDIX family)